LPNVLQFHPAAFGIRASDFFRVSAFGIRIFKTYHHIKMR
jgi:hypothetical protein